MLAKSGVGFILGDSQQAVDRICGVAVTTGIEVRWVKVHNSIKHLKQLRTSCPNTRLIGRLTAPEWLFSSFIRQIEAGEPLLAADAAIQYYTMMDQLIDVDAPKNNMWWETCPPGFSSWNYSSWLNDYYIAIMKLMEADGRRGLICNFFTGTPHTKSDGTDGWTPFMPAIQYAAAHGHIIGAQAYWQLPDIAMGDPGNWTAYRPLRVIGDYAFPEETIWVPSEFGFDGPGGYRNFNISGLDYFNANVRADQKFISNVYPNGRRKVDGFVMYILQAWGSEWDSFLFWEIFDQLLAYIVAEGPDTGVIPPPPPPPPPPPSNEIWTVKVVSWVNQRSGPGQNYAWLGSIQATNPPTVLKVYSKQVNGYLGVVGQGWWVYSNNGSNLVRVG